MRDYGLRLAPDVKTSQWAEWKIQAKSFKQRAEVLKQLIKAERDPENKKRLQERLERNKWHWDVHVLVTNYAAGEVDWLCGNHKFVLRLYWRLLQTEDPYWLELDEAETSDSSVSGKEDEEDEEDETDEDDEELEDAGDDF